MEHTEELDIELEGKNQVYLLYLARGDLCIGVSFN